MWGEGDLLQKVCDSGEFVGNLWAEMERKRERESEGERKRQREGEGERDTEREEEGEGEEEGRERVLWALGGNLCVAFESWGSYNHPFVTSQKRYR